MISDALVHQAVNVVLRQLRKRFSGLDKDELRSAANLGVAKAVAAFREDQTKAVFLWLTIAGRTCALNELRDTGFLTRDHMQKPAGDPDNPICETDLTDHQRDQLARRNATEAPRPGDGELFDHPCLTDDEKTVLVARYVDNLTWAEVGERLGIKPGVCRYWHANALKKLHRAIPEEDK